MAALGAGSAWAVGRSRALALRWNGTRWSIVPIPDADLTETALHDVAVIAPDDVWAVGWSNRGPLALPWDGSAWTRSRDAETGPAHGLNGVAATRSNRVFMAGSAAVGTGSSRRYAPMIQIWNGTQWSVTKQGRLAAHRRHVERRHRRHAHPAVGRRVLLRRWAGTPLHPAALRDLTRGQVGAPTIDPEV